MQDTYRQVDFTLNHPPSIILVHLSINLISVLCQSRQVMKKLIAKNVVQINTSHPTAMLLQLGQDLQTGEHLTLISYLVTVFLLEYLSIFFIECLSVNFLVKIAVNFLVRKVVAWIRGYCVQL